jgi:hypothetical protein
MHTWTIVTDALAPAGAREARTLAARGKDLVLFGPRRAPLEMLAAELRITHRVDVRVLLLDFADPGAADAAAYWLNGRDRPVDGIVAVRTDDPRVARGVERLIAALSPEMRRRGLGGARFVDAERDRTSTAPSLGAPAAAFRARRSTQPGYADPSARLV